MKACPADEQTPEVVNPLAGRDTHGNGWVQVSNLASSRDGQEEGAERHPKHHPTLNLAYGRGIDTWCSETQP